MNEKNNKYLVLIVGDRVDDPYHGTFLIEAKSLLEAFNKASEEIKKESNTFKKESNMFIIVDIDMADWASLNSESIIKNLW